MLNNQYFCYHLHSDYSSCITNIDSVTKIDMYINYAKELGMSALAFSEHGSILNWFEKKTKIEKAGMKYVHAAEVYVTESIAEKVRDNYHCVLISKNINGFKELNKLITKSFNRQDNHFYYTPRITLDDLLSTSENIIVTSACLGGVLSKGNDDIKDRMIGWMTDNQDRCFLEIQHHNVEKQIDYNRYLLDLHKRTGIRLVAGTDTHSLNSELAEARVVLQHAKNTFFSDEEGWDLTFKSYDELVSAYTNQDSVPMEFVLDAINNTNIIADMVEPFEVDMTPKFPDLYEDAGLELRKATYEAIDKHPYALKNHKREDIVERVEYELGELSKANMESFLMFKKSINDWQHENNIYAGPSRGSVSGSMVAYLLGITEMDSMKFDLNFFRFCNSGRVSNPDIDEDLYDEDRDECRKFLLTNPSIKSSEIVAFGTIQIKGAIRDVGRALGIPLDEVGQICKQIPINDKKKDYIPDNLRKKYPELFKYVELLNGVIVSVGTHPAGVLCATRDIDEEVGLFTLSTTDYPVSCLDMYGLDACWWTKMDELGLDNIGIINKTCELAGIDRINPDNIDLEDMAVWNSISEDTTAIFQYESDMSSIIARNLLNPDTVRKIRISLPDVSMLRIFSFGNALIRPSGSSIRETASKGNLVLTGIAELDNLLKGELGNCIEENQEVLTDKGYIKIKDLKVGQKVVTTNGLEVIECVFNNGVKEVFSVTLSNGLEIICTESHKLLTPMGFTPLKECNIGTSLATHLGCFNAEGYNHGKLRLIAWLLGDGTLGQSKAIYLTNNSLEVCQEFKKCVESEFRNLTVTISPMSTRSGTKIYRATVVYNVKDETYKKGNIFFNYLKDLGLKYNNGGVKSCYKFIPQFIEALNYEEIKCFIGAFMDTDFGIWENQCVFVSTSKKMMETMQRLIYLIGYSSNFFKSEGAYRVRINEPLRFINDLKKYTIKYRDTVDYNLSNTFGVGGKIDYNSAHLLSIEHCEQLAITRSQIKASKHGLYNLSINKKNHPKFVYADSIPELVDRDQKYWCQIKSIEKLGAKQVYDLQIQNTHNYVVNGVIVHNCIVQEDQMLFVQQFCGFDLQKADYLRKCIGKDALVTMGDGSLKPIQEIKIGDTVQSFANGAYKPNRVTNVWNNGFKDVYKVTTQNGFSIKSTNDHKYLTINGWEELKNLKVGDTLFTPERIHGESDNRAPNQRISSTDMFLIGALIGDGTIDGNYLYFTNSDIKMIDKYKECINAHSRSSNECEFNIYEKDGITVEKVYRVSIKSKSYSRSIRNILKKYNLNTKSVDKHLPRELISYPADDKLANLLAGLFSTDGGFNTSNLSIEYYSISKRLIMDIQAVLLKFGIFSTIQKKYVKDYEYYSYTLMIVGTKYQRIFKDKIWKHMVGDKKNKMENIIQKKQSCPQSFNYMLPKECRTEIIENSISLNIPIQSLKTGGFRLDKKVNGITDTLAYDLCNKVYSPITYKLLNYQQVPQLITSIEYAGVEEVYDIEVEENHNFVANGITVHNCIGKKLLEQLNSLVPEIKEGFKKHSKPKYGLSEDDVDRITDPIIECMYDSSRYAFSWNHSDAYSFIGYACGYLRYYYPLEFVTTCLNIWQDKEEKTATSIALANKFGFKINEPKFRYSRAKYFFDKSTQSIYKGMRSIKFLSERCAEDLYSLRDNTYNFFMELLLDISNIDANRKQIEILITLDYFSEFGNAKELMMIYKMFDFFKKGKAKSFNKTALEHDHILYNIVKSHSNETEKQFTKLETPLILKDCEEFIRCQNIKDFSLKEKIETQKEYLGYINMCTGLEEDRPKLIVLDQRVMISKFGKDEGKPWCVSIRTHSVGSGKKGSFTVPYNIYKKEPFKEMDIIHCKEYKRKKAYWYIYKYNLIF